MGIGSKLETLIKSKGRNVNDVAKAANVPASTVYSIIKRDNTKADLDDLQRIASVLGVTLEYFVDAYEPNTIAAHHDDYNWTEEELKEIEDFKKYVLSKRTNR